MGGQPIPRVWRSVVWRDRRGGGASSDWSFGPASGPSPPTELISAAAPLGGACLRDAAAARADAAHLGCIARVAGLAEVAGRMSGVDSTGWRPQTAGQVRE